MFESLFDGRSAFQQMVCFRKGVESVNTKTTVSIELNLCGDGNDMHRYCSDNIGSNTKVHVIRALYAVNRVVYALPG